MRCRVAEHGTAATSVGAAARGVCVPRGGATSELSDLLGLAASTWSLTVYVHLGSGALPRPQRLCLRSNSGMSEPNPQVRTGKGADAPPPETTIRYLRA